jgi:hypothetical protein
VVKGYREVSRVIIDREDLQHPRESPLEQAVTKEKEEVERDKEQGEKEKERDEEKHKVRKEEEQEEEEEEDKGLTTTMIRIQHYCITHTPGFGIIPGEPELSEQGIKQLQDWNAPPLPKQPKKEKPPNLQRPSSTLGWSSIFKEEEKKERLRTESLLDEQKQKIEEIRERQEKKKQIVLDRKKMDKKKQRKRKEDRNSD